MEKEKFEEVIENLKLERYKWQYLNEFDSIEMKDGKGFYSDWKHLRFLIGDKFIFVKHGISEPYGARLSYIFNISYDGTTVSFPPGNPVLPSDYYGEFRAPKQGDIIRSTISTTNILSESLITEVYNSGNSFIIKVLNPIKMNKESKLSFYDPTVYDKELCMHSSEVEGIYMKFKENPGKKSKYGIFHEIIKIKNIKSINLKLSVKQKTYKIS